MFYRLLFLNWKIFVSNLNRFQLLLLTGYIIFLGIMLVNLSATALLVVMLDTDPWMKMQLPWLTPEIYTFILLVFANTYWIMHFSFTNLRLLNIEENRKLLGFGFPLKQLTKYLMLIGFFHPVNIIYNFTWLIFLLIQVNYAYQVPIILIGVLVNYLIIYSIKHRFIQIVERRFIAVIVFFMFFIFALFQFVSLFTENSREIFAQIIPRVEVLNSFLSWLPGGLFIQGVNVDYGWTNAAILLAILIPTCALFLFDHFRNTKKGLLNPTINKAEEQTSKLWQFLRKIFGINAGKYYYYVMIHPYNKLQLLTLALIPVVYVPLLLQLDYPIAKTILIPTILAGIPVALLAMGMANMYGYENRELLLHIQFPVKLERQLKERFLGIFILPLIIFYIITILELLYIPELGSPIKIFVSNTFFFLCFMLLFIWSSYYQYQKATYSSFSYKHPIIPQKVTFVISFALFTMGYLVFVPIGDLDWYRITIMATVILIIGVYLWQHMILLVNLFKKQVLQRLWTHH